MNKSRMSILGKGFTLDLLVPAAVCVISILVIHPGLIMVLKDSLLFCGSLWRLGDGAGSVFYFAHVSRALFGPESLIYTNRFFFPEGGCIRGHLITQSLALVFAPVIRLWGIPFGFNISMLIVMVGNGLGMYLLGRLLVRERGISLAGALIYAIAPPLMGEIFILHRPVSACWGPALAGMGLLCLYLERRSSLWIGILAGGLLAFTGILYPFNLVYLSMWILAICAGVLHKDAAARSVVPLLWRMVLVLGVIFIIVGPFVVWVANTTAEFVKYQSPYITGQERVLHFPLNALFSGIEATRHINTYWLCIPSVLTLGAFFSVIVLRRKILSLLPHIIGGAWALWISLGPRIDIAGLEEWSEVSQSPLPAWPWMPHVFLSTRLLGFGRMNAQRAVFVLLAAMTVLFMKGMVRICANFRNLAESGAQYKGRWAGGLLIPALFVILFAWYSMPRYTERYIPWPDFIPIRVASADRVVLNLPINMKMFPLFLSLLHKSPSLGGADSIDGARSGYPQDGKILEFWKKNTFLHSLYLISEEKSPLLVKQQDLEALSNIGLRHVFFWKGYYQRNLPAKAMQEYNRTYQFLLQALGKPVAASTEVVVFRIPQHQ